MHPFFTSAQKQVTIQQVPGAKNYTSIDPLHGSVLPSGRIVSPVGKMIRITHDPFGMAVSPDGKKAVTLHNGVFTIIDLTSMEHTRVPSYDGSVASPLSNGSFLGVAFSSDSKKVWLSGGDNGAVILYDITAQKRLDSISLNGRVNEENFEDSFTADLSLYEEKMNCWY